MADALEGLRALSKGEDVFYDEYYEYLKSFVMPNLPTEEIYSSPTDMAKHLTDFLKSQREFEQKCADCVLHLVSLKKMLNDLKRADINMPAELFPEYNSILEKLKDMEKSLQGLVSLYKDRKEFLSNLLATTKSAFSNITRLLRT